MIIFSHFSYHGYVEMGGGKVITNLLNLSFLKLIFTGNIGTGLFMIITGFFLCTSTQLKANRLLSVIIQVFTYSVLCYCYYIIMYAGGCFSPKDVFTALTPLIHETNWYFSAYVLIYLFHPYLNRLIQHASRKELRNLIILMTIVWGIIPVFFFVKFCRSNFLFFVLMYFVGAYIRLYPVGWYVDNYKKILLVSITAWVFIASMPMWTTKQISDLASLFYMNGSPLVLLMASSLFLFFKNKTDIPQSRLVNIVAASSGGIYLLHDNPYIRSFLYTDIFHLEQYMTSDYMCLYTIAFVVITYIVCGIFEYMRKSIYEACVIVLNKRH